VGKDIKDARSWSAARARPVRDHPAAAEQGAGDILAVDINGIVHPDRVTWTRTGLAAVQPTPSGQRHLHDALATRTGHRRVRAQLFGPTRWPR